MQAQTLIDNWEGFHNRGDYVQRLEKEGLYKDCSTICIIPTRGVVSAQVIQNWMHMVTPMNQKFLRYWKVGLEVGEAYNQAIGEILSHPELSKWKYILTLEEDNTIPPDGLLKLINAMNEHPEFDAIGGLYWTKGEGGQPMCYGNPNTVPVDFVPQIPTPEKVTECNGLGMGFTIFRMEMFNKIEKPWFKTLQQFDPGTGAAMMTQDLYFFQKARLAGCRVGCDSRVKVGHFDASTGMVW